MKFNDCHRSLGNIFFTLLTHFSFLPVFGQRICNLSSLMLYIILMFKEEISFPGRREVQASHFYPTVGSTFREIIFKAWAWMKYSDTLFAVKDIENWKLPPSFSLIVIVSVTNYVNDLEQLHFSRVGTFSSLISGNF